MSIILHDGGFIFHVKMTGKRTGLVQEARVLPLLEEKRPFIMSTFHESPQDKEKDQRLGDAVRGSKRWRGGRGT